MTTSLLLTLLLCVHLLTISKSQSLANYANLQIFRKTNTTLLATWDYNGDVSRSTLHISYATTASFIPGTLIGELVVANTSNLNQAMLHLPSIEQSPIVIVTHVRLSLSNDKHFIESSPWITTSQCGDGSHYLNDTTWDGELEPDVSRWTCNICPKNARCLGGISNTWHSVTAYFGTWRHNQADRGASNFSQCLAPRMCLGAPNKQLEGLYGLDPVTGIDVALLDNYTEGCDASKHAGGPLCSVCSNNTWRDSSFECIECSDRSMSIFLMILAFVFMIAVLVVAIAVTIFDEETPTAIDLQMVKIMVNHLVISSSTSKLPLKWSPWLVVVFRFFDALSFSFGTGAMSLECVVSHLAWKETLILVAVTPFVLILLPMLILFPCDKMWLKKCRIDAKVTAQVSAMIGLLLAHPTITKVSLYLFACRNINGKRYLEADFSVDCDDSVLLITLRWMLGVPMIILFCIGIPVWYFARLWVNRNDFDAVRMQYGFLLSGFKPTRFYWELYNTCRKGFFTATTVLFLPFGARLQIWATMALLQLFLAMETWGHPHVNPVLNTMEDKALTLDVFQLFLGLGLFFVTDRGINNLAEIFSVVILLLNVVFIVYWFRIWWQFSEYRVKAKDAIITVRQKAKSMSFSSAKSWKDRTGKSSKAMRTLGLDEDYYDTTRAALYGSDGGKSIKVVDINGEVYLYNEDTGSRKKAEVTGDTVGVGEEYRSRASDALNSISGSGWVQLMDGDGQIFWFNGKTGKETYTNPTKDGGGKDGGDGGGDFVGQQDGHQVVPKKKKRRPSCRTPLVLDHSESEKNKKTAEMTNIMVVEKKAGAADSVGNQTTKKMEEGNVLGPTSRGGSGGGGRGKTRWKKIQKNLKASKRRTKEEERKRQSMHTSDMNKRLQHLIAASKRG